MVKASPVSVAWVVSIAGIDELAVHARTGCTETDLGDIGQERANQIFGEAPVDVDKPFSPAARARALTL